MGLLGRPVCIFIKSCPTRGQGKASEGHRLCPMFCPSMWPQVGLELELGFLRDVLRQQKRPGHKARWRV